MVDKTLNLKESTLFYKQPKYLRKFESLNILKTRFKIYLKDHWKFNQ